MHSLPDICLAADIDPHPRDLLRLEDDLWDLVVGELDDGDWDLQIDLGEAES